MEHCLCSSVCAAVSEQQCLCSSVCATVSVQQCLCNRIYVAAPLQLCLFSSVRTAVWCLLYLLLLLTFVTFKRNLRWRQVGINYYLRTAGIVWVFLKLKTRVAIQEPYKRYIFPLLYLLFTQPMVRVQTREVYFLVSPQ